MLERLRSGKRGERGGKHKGTREHDLVFVLQSKLQRENAGTREKNKDDNMRLRHNLLLFFFRGEPCLSAP